MNVRVTATVRRWLQGTGAYQDPDNDTADVVAVIVGICDYAPTDSRGVTRVDLDADAVAILREYASYMEGAAHDDAASGDMSAMGELNAARALLRQLEPTCAEVTR